jgi:cell division protein FtsX
LYWSRADAFAEYQKQYPTNSAGLTAAGFPPSFHVRMRSPDADDQMSALLQSMPGVSKIAPDFSSIPITPVTGEAEHAVFECLQSAFPSP